LIYICPINVPKMKTSLLIVSLFIAVFSFAQNGGQLNQSGSLKIEQFGYANGKAWIRITNKQSCLNLVEVKFGGTTITETVKGNSVDTLLLTIPVGTNLKAKPLTGCSVNFDNGNIELTIAGQALSVKFLSFDATVNNKAVLLQWITEEEQVNHYIIQVSSDGNNWKDEAMVFAGSKTYSYTDHSGSSYYRIVSVDNSGSLDYSRIIRISQQSNKLQLEVYPNPVVSSATVSLQAGNTAKISLYSISGVLLKQVDPKGQKMVKIDLTGLQDGMYYVSDGVSTVKINKQ
jgi:hypothetical protein